MELYLVHLVPNTRMNRIYLFANHCIMPFPFKIFGEILLENFGSVLTGKMFEAWVVQKFLLAKILLN